MKIIIERVLRTVSFVVMVSIAHIACANYYHVRDEKRLHHVLDKYDLVVALFYNKKMAQTPVKQLFKQLSRGYSYHEADVAFISIDIARADGATIASDYGIKKTPTMILFKDGGLALDKDKAPAMATRVRSLSDMRIFINSYFGDLIEDELREREECARRMGRKRYSRSHMLFGIGYGYQYYPYYGYPFGYSYGYPIYMGE